MESYKNDKSVREVIINIAEEIENENLEEVARCNLLPFYATDQHIRQQLRKTYVHNFFRS